MKSNNKISVLEKKAKQESKLDQDLIILTIIASLLAVYGIKMNSPYVLIGSMLVSPLFDPVISTVVFYFEKNIDSLKKSIKSLLVALLISISVSLIFWLLLFITGQLDNFQHASTIVNVADTTGVAILMGIVGTLLWIWPKTSNTSAGVAIAISLVPPIANFTGGVVLGNYQSAFTYLSILLLNLLGIIIGISITLKIYMNGKYKTRL